MAGLRIALLGGLEIAGDKSSARSSLTRKARALVAYLVLQGGRGGRLRRNSRKGRIRISVEPGIDLLSGDAQRGPQQVLDLTVDAAQLIAGPAP